MLNFKFWLATISLVSLAGGISYYLYRKTAEPIHLSDAISENQNTPDVTKGTILASEKREMGKFNPFDYHFIPGKAYQISFVREVAGEAQKEPGKLASFGESKISGDMIVNSIKYDNNKIYVIVKYNLKTLVSPLFHFTIAHEFGILKSPNGTTISAKNASDKYKNTLAFELTPTGRTLRISKLSKKGMSDEGAVLSSDALSAALFALPTETPPNRGGSVKRKMNDEKGTPFEMDLTYSSSDANTLNIKGYTEIAPPAPKPGARDMGFYPKTTRDLNVVWDKKIGLPKSLSSNLDQEVKIQGQKIAGGRTSIVSSWDAAGDSQYSVDDLKLYGSIVDMEVLRKKSEIKHDSKESKFARWSTAQASLSKLGTMNETQKEAAFNDLSDLLKKNPDLAGQYAAEAKAVGPTSPAVSMILGALGSSGSPEAQKAMIDLFKSEDATKDTKEKVVMEMALSPEPLIPESKALMEDLYHDKTSPDLASQAGYALGSSLSKAPDSALVTEIKNNYRAASDVETKVYLLQVMGNDRGSDFRSEVMTATNSSDPNIRAAGADALRFADDAAGRTALFGATSDGDPNVQAVAYRVLQYQQYDTKTFNALSSCVKGESNDSVRAVCYDVLCSHLNDQNTVSVLQSRVNAETNESLKMKITEALKPAQ